MATFSTSYAISNISGSGGPAYYKKNQISGFIPRMEVKQAPVLFEIRGRYKPPCKDYCRLLITEKGVSFSIIPVCLPSRNISPVPSIPNDFVMSFQTFKSDPELHEELEHIFGRHVIHRAQLVAGRYNLFGTLENKLALHVISYMTVKTILSLGQTSKHFHKLCNSQNLWKKLNNMYRAFPYDDVRFDQKLITRIGWKRFYFMKRDNLDEEDLCIIEDRQLDNDSNYGQQQASKRYSWRRQ